MPKRKFAAGQGGKVKRARRFTDSKVKRLVKLVAEPKKAITSSFPASMRVRQRYFDYIASTGATLGNLFNINSTFDPDRTLTGHQPNGRDTMASIYAKYKVHGCYVKVRWVASVAGAYLYALAPVNNAQSLQTDIRTVIETPGTKFGACDIGSSSKELSMYVDCSKVAGVSKMVYEADSIYGAAVGANPTEVMTVGVYATKVDGSLLTASYVFAEVQIDYDVTYYDEDILAQS